MAHDVDASDTAEHPDPDQLERFMRNEAEPAERRWIVRHLIAGCPRCLAVTSELWALGDPPAGARRRGSGEPRSGIAAAETYPGIFERLAEVGERIEAEREQAPRLVAELLAMPPAARAALLAGRRGGDLREVSVSAGGEPTRLRVMSVSPSGEPAIGVAAPDRTLAGRAVPVAGAGERFATPPVCQLLLERSRAAAAGNQRLAVQAAELALAIGERLDEAGCGAAVTRGLRARAWAHLGHARRLGGDLEGAEWALAHAEALAAGETGDDAWTREMGMAVETGDGAPEGENHEPGGRAGERREPSWLEDAGGRGREDGRADAPGGPAGAYGESGFEPAEWAELLLFKAGLGADRGELGAADRLLGRAARLFRSAGETHRAGVALAEQGSIRAELGDRRRAAELLRAGIDLLDVAAAPRRVAATLCRLAELVGGVWPPELAIAPPGSTGPVGVPTSPSGSSAPASAAAGSADPASPAAARTGPAAGAGSGRRGAEALQLLDRARALYKGLGDAAAEARLLRLQGQIEAALGRLDEAESTLRTAIAELNRFGFGRDASRALAELALVLVRLGRGGEVCQLGLERRSAPLARDKSWSWFSGALVFQVAAYRYGDDADAGADADLDVELMSELARYLAVPPLTADSLGHGRRAAPRLTRVA